PVRWGCSSVGRAQGWQSWGQGFEPPQLHQFFDAGSRSDPWPRTRFASRRPLAAHEDEVSRVDPRPHQLVGWDELMSEDGPHLEASLDQSIRDIEAIEPYVIRLPEQALALGWIGDGRILEGRLAGDRDLDHGPASRSQDATELAHRATIVRHVLQDVAAQDDVERRVGHLDPGEIERDHGMRAIQIPRTGVEPPPIAEQR